MSGSDSDEHADVRLAYAEPTESRETLSREHAGRSASTPDDVPRECQPAPPDVDPALARTIQNEVIPRLLMAHRSRELRETTVRSDTPIRSDDVETLVALSLRDTPAAIRAFLDTLQTRGLTVDALVGELLPAAARHVGWMWETDACTFVDVTCSLTRLQQMLRHYAPSLAMEMSRAGEGRRMLLSSMPGEQHTFGIAVAEEFFRQAAWEVVPQMPLTARNLLDNVAAEWFDVVGLSASSDGALGAMPALIQRLRGASLNQSVRVIIGGAALARCPDVAERAGADAIARDARDGIEKMEWMMRALRQPC